MTNTEPAEAEPESRKASARRWKWHLLGAAAWLLSLVIFILLEHLHPESQVMAQAVHFHLAASTTILALLIAAWCVARISRPIFAEPSFSEWARMGQPSRDQERLKTYVLWFVQMRWLAASISILLTITVRHAGELLPKETTTPLLVTTGTLILCNVLYLLLLRRGRGIAHLLATQAYVDLLILATLLHFGGGIENPLAFVCVFHVIIAGILLSPLQCYLTAAAASLSIGVMAWAEWARLIEHYPLALFPRQHLEEEAVYAVFQSAYVGSAVGFLTVTLFLVAFFVTTLAERARADEQRALAARQLMEQALTTTGTGLCVITPQKRYYWASRRWQEWFLPGHENSEAPAEAWVVSLAEEALRTGAAVVGERVLPDGKQEAAAARRRAGQRVFQITTAPLIGEDAQGCMVVGLAQDVTAQKRVQAQLLQAGKMAALGELAANIAHEINNPMGIVSAKGRLLISRHQAEMSAGVAKEVQKITDAADRVTGITQRLLSYGRPSVAQRGPLDLRLPVRHALGMVEHRARCASVTIEDRLPEQLPYVQANANEIQQVFLNLFLNALDAMPKGGRLTVSGSTGKYQDRGGKRVAIVVEDSGMGMTPEVLERVFDPFFTTKDEGKGTGLGLSICLSLVEAYGGDIEVQSAVGSGTQVAVYLPSSGDRSTASSRLLRSAPSHDLKDIGG